MDTVRIKNHRTHHHQTAQERQIRAGATLPQPGLRLMGVTSLGLGAGLYSAEAPLMILVLAFIPALVAMIVIAVRSSLLEPDESHVRNAMARWNQTDFPSKVAKEQARRKILTTARRHRIEVSEEDRVAKGHQT